MRKLAVLSVAFALVSVSFYGCDDGLVAPESSAESASEEQRPLFERWQNYDEDCFWHGPTERFDACLQEQVVLTGEYGGWDLCYASWWRPTRDIFHSFHYINIGAWLVGPSGTWELVEYIGPNGKRIERPGTFLPENNRNGPNVSVWENLETGVLMYRKISDDSEPSFSLLEGACRFKG
jgi:hypothetical protein